MSWEDTKRHLRQKTAALDGTVDNIVSTVEADPLDSSNLKNKVTTVNTASNALVSKIQTVKSGLDEIVNSMGEYINAN